MLVAVRPTITLPHKVQIGHETYFFEPKNANVPESWGIPAVANKKGPYFVPTTEDPVHEELYKWNQEGKNALLEECTKAATTAQYEEILAFARKLVFPQKDTTFPRKTQASRGAGEKALDEMSISELMDDAKRHNIVIPSTVTKKADIAALIQEELNKRIPPSLR